MSTLSSTSADFQRRFYYLVNFERALEWLRVRYDDLWNNDERAFLLAFPGMPLSSRALLVRMLMRKGPFFRASKLMYDEIGSPLEAAAPLDALGWVDAQSPLTLDDIFALHTKAELGLMFAATPGHASARKSELRDRLRARNLAARPYSDWHPQACDRVLRLNVALLCERLRLMFFGNLRQSWSEFVLADLGVVRYEQVALDPSARPFRSRDDIDTFLTLHAYRDLLDAYDDIDGAPSLKDMIDAIEALPCSQEWLEQRRQKLMYRIGQHCERRRQWDAAFASYGNCSFPGARHRSLRMLEHCGRYDEAHRLALQANHAFESEEEAQRIARMLPRLRRKLGLPTPPSGKRRTVERIELTLQRPSEPSRVEAVVLEALREPGATVHYVENALINSLFGLLCWDAIFAPVPGAFFHPYQRGPADLHSPTFHITRRDAFERCLALLDGGDYPHAIRATFVAKAGLQSPFVHWSLLTGELLEQALLCIPAAHMKQCFVRLMKDVRSNRTGFPDLIRFWPAQRRYEMVEVKGPGDQLQDNQIRWLAACAGHGMPIRVIHVQWDQDVAGATLTNPR
jgi:VRR-NUC domain/Fanconi anemia-associated nuclease SAP domain